MDDQQAPSLGPSSAAERNPLDSCPMPRAPLKIKIKQTQIQEKPLGPEMDSQLVVFDDRITTRSSRRKRPIAEQFHGHVQAKSSAMDRAKELQANLADEFPSFIKSMVRSNVSCVFWLHLPIQFCKSHLPRHDTAVTLEDESEEEYNVSYIAERTALSAGWKKFSASHELLEGDVLVFHLIGPAKFKVYIERAHDSSNPDGGLGLIDFSAKPINSVPMEENSETCKTAKHLELLPPDHIQNNNGALAGTECMHVAHLSEHERKDLALETLENIRTSGDIVDFKEIRSMDDFSVIVNGLSIDADLSDHHRVIYYKLCCSQNSFLHDDLLKSINHKLAAEMITQTVNISEAIRASTLSTSEADFVLWDKTLKGFELLGMNVGFLRARLNLLMTHAFESEEAAESQRYRELSLKKAEAEEEVRTIELKLLELQEGERKLDEEIDFLKVDAEKHMLQFQAAAHASW